MAFLVVGNIWHLIKKKKPSARTEKKKKNQENSGNKAFWLQIH